MSVNIRTVGSHGCYRLLDEKMGLRCRVIPVLNAPGTETWEDDGGACPPPPYEEVREIKLGRQIRLRGSRKQGAARMYRRIETSAVHLVDGEKVYDTREQRPAAAMQDIRTTRLGVNIYSGVTRSKSKSKSKADVKKAVAQAVSVRNEDALKQIAELEIKLAALLKK